MEHFWSIVSISLTLINSVDHGLFCRSWSILSILVHSIDFWSITSTRPSCLVWSIILSVDLAQLRHLWSILSIFVNHIEFDQFPQFLDNVSFRATSLPFCSTRTQITYYIGVFLQILPKDPEPMASRHSKSVNCKWYWYGKLERKNKTSIFSLVMDRILPKGEGTGT